jgi:hypothetical protein
MAFKQRCKFLMQEDTTMSTATPSLLPTPSFSTPVTGATGAARTPAQAGASRCLHLAPGHHLLLEPEPALRVTCVSGELWLTRHGDSTDHCLRPGDSLTLDGHAVLLSPLRKATTGATLCLERQRAATQPGAGFWQTLGHWAARHLAPRWHSAANAHFRWRLQHGLYNG